MPTLQFPSSDKTRMELLEHALTTAGKDFDAGNFYISKETFNTLTEFIPSYRDRMNKINASKSNRSKEIRESSEAFSMMTTTTRDMWEVLRRRVNRINEPAEVLTYYELPLDGLTPKPTSNAEWYALAASMIDGDAKAVAAGYTAMQNPSALDLREALEKARKEKSDISQADREYDEAQEGLEDLRAKADELISDVIDDLRYFLRKKDGPSQRRIMRTYGVTFKYLRGEPEDEMPEEEVE
jgi:hypothetical protein